LKKLLGIAAALALAGAGCNNNTPNRPNPGKADVASPSPGGTNAKDGGGTGGTTSPPRNSR